MASGMSCPMRYAEPSPSKFLSSGTICLSNLCRDPLLQNVKCFLPVLGQSLYFKNDRDSQPLSIRPPLSRVLRTLSCSVFPWAEPRSRASRTKRMLTRECRSRQLLWRTYSMRSVGRYLVVATAFTTCDVSTSILYLFSCTKGRI